MKTAIRDYFQSFKVNSAEAFRYTDNQLLLIAMAASMLSLTFSERTVRDTVVILALYLPMLFTQLDVYIHPVKFDKLKYLCPMSVEERKNLINNEYSFRIAIDMILSLVGVCVIAIVGSPKPISLFIIVFNNLILASRAIAREVSEDSKIAAKKSGIRYVTEVFAWIISVIQLPLLTSNEPKVAAQITFLIIEIVVELPLFVFLYKQVKEELRLAVNFEED